MKGKPKTRDERLRAAAIVKLKYTLLSGRMDKGFQMVYEGVLGDLAVREDEVDAFIEEHREELEKICLQRT
jgi:hypothetical protein